MKALSSDVLDAVLVMAVAARRRFIVARRDERPDAVVTELDHIQREFFRMIAWVLRDYHNARTVARALIVAAEVPAPDLLNPERCGHYHDRIRTVMHREMSLKEWRHDHRDEVALLFRPVMSRGPIRP